MSALQSDGALLADAHSALVFQILFVQFNVALFGVALIAAGWNMSRLYVYPASTPTLVAWRLLPAMALTVVESVAWTAALNSLFPLDWPLWGPALFSAAAVAALEAAVWLTQRSRWIIAALSVVGAVLGSWFKSRYGSMFGQPSHPWAVLTAPEALALAGFAAAAFGIAVVAVGRNRRGESPFTLGLVAWLERLIDRLFDRPPSRSRPFLTPRTPNFGWRGAAAGSRPS